MVRDARRAALLTMRVQYLPRRELLPHPEEPRSGVSKDKATDLLKGRT
jgi:hypothetical protein